MNNRFYIAILALATLFAGCSKTDVATPKEKAVTFQVGSYAPQTKAEGDTVSLNGIGINDFRSFAYLHAEGFMETPQAFFGEEGETISFNGTDEWAPSHDYFWPKTSASYINFISWRGGDSNTDISYAKKEGSWVANFAWEDMTVAVTDTLLIADMAWRYSANVNPATYQAYNGVTEGVPTLFHHALSQVKVLAKVTKTEEADVTWEVTLGWVIINGVYNTGTLSMTNTDPGTKGTKEWTLLNDGWSIDDTVEPVTIGKTGYQTLTTNPEIYFDWQSVIPQAVGDKKFAISYSVKTKYGTSGPTVEETVYVNDLSLSTIGVSSWNMNSRITYIISINPDTGEIKIIPVETDWLTEAEYPINIE